MGNNVSLKQKHYLDRKHASDGDKEKASDAEVNNNQAKMRQEPTDTTQKGPKKFWSYMKDYYRQHGASTH